MSYLPPTRLLMAGLLWGLTLAPIALAEKDHDRTQVGHTINIASDELVTDATCFGCSIRVRGHVSSDVTAFGGNVVIEQNGQVDGDVTAFAGSVRLEKGATVKGDLTVFGGRIQRDPAATVGGDVTNMGGPGWIVLIFLTPMIFLGLFVALIVWIIRRLLRPAMPSTA